MVEKQKEYRFVRVKIITGRPKRKSGVYLLSLSGGLSKQNTTKRKNRCGIVYLKTFQKYQLEEGPCLFNGAEFKLIEV